MGSYVVSADLQSAAGGSVPFTELADLDDDGTADTAVVTQAIERAEARVNGYLRKRYAVPLTAPVPSIVKDLTLDLARYYLASNRGLNDLEVYYRNYKDALAVLAEIRAGHVDLDVTDKPTGSPVVTTGGLLEPLTQDEGGPYWDETYREEGEVDEGFWSS